MVLDERSRVYAVVPFGDSPHAVVFSCSLRHQATPVTQRLRYCYLPFLYDDAAARVGLV